MIVDKIIEMVNEIIKEEAEFVRDRNPFEWTKHFVVVGNDFKLCANLWDRFSLRFIHMLMCLCLCLCP